MLMVMFPMTTTGKVMEPLLSLSILLNAASISFSVAPGLSSILYLSSPSPSSFYLFFFSSFHLFIFFLVVFLIFYFFFFFFFFFFTCTSHFLLSCPSGPEMKIYHVSWLPLLIIGVHNWIFYY